MEYVTRIASILDAPYVREVLGHARIMEILMRSQPLLFCGHFELISGNHTDTYFRFADIAQFPDLMTEISNEMVAWARMANLGRIDVVLSTNREGMVLAYDVARALNKDSGTRAVYAATDPETGSPVNYLMDGFEIRKHEKILVVNDLMTTTNGLQTLIGLAKKQQAKVVGVCVFASRAPDSALAKLSRNHQRFHTACKLRVSDWPRWRCSLCKKGVSLVLERELASYKIQTPIEKVLEPYYRQAHITCYKA